MSAQAVGGAVGHNPISIIVPCHRVVGANGSLTGYGGGIMRKKALLELEGLDLRRFTIPKLNIRAVSCPDHECSGYVIMQGRPCSSN
jgi:alkylated DNA nucleotide flippase Atl1